MRAYANPVGSDPAVVSGESGAVTYGLLLSILQSDELRRLFHIDENSVILLISTEGDTDPDGYRRHSINMSLRFLQLVNRTKSTALACAAMYMV